MTRAELRELIRRAETHSVIIRSPGASLAGGYGRTVADVLDEMALFCRTLVASRPVQEHPLPDSACDPDGDYRDLPV